MYHQSKLLSLILVLNSYGAFGMEEGETVRKEKEPKKPTPILVEQLYRSSSHIAALQGAGYAGGNGYDYKYAVYLSVEAQKDKTWSQKQLIAQKTVDLLKAIDERGHVREPLPLADDSDFLLADRNATIYACTNGNKETCSTFLCEERDVDTEMEELSPIN